MRKQENNGDGTARVLVNLHIFYEEYVPYYMDKLRNISGCEWDLVVTGHNLSPETQRMILGFKENAVFYKTPNVGYDVWPFICAVKKTDLDKYLFVIKLHTKNQDNVKNRLNGIWYTGAQWRSELVDVLLGSEHRFLKVLQIFRERPEVGLVYSMSLDIRRGCKLVEDSDVLTDEMNRIGIVPKSGHFCGGTMFAARAEALEWLKDERIDESIFQPSEGSHSTASMAHVYERILSMAVNAAGYRTCLLKNSWWRFLRLKAKQYLQPALEWMFSIDYHGKKAEKMLTVMGVRFKLQTDANA